MLIGTNKKFIAVSYSISPFKFFFLLEIVELKVLQIQLKMQGIRYAPYEGGLSI